MPTLNTDTYATMISRLARTSTRHVNRIHNGTVGWGTSSSSTTSSLSGMMTRSFSITSTVYQQGSGIKTTFHLPDPNDNTKYHQLTKIVATIGPTSEQEEPLKKVVQAGMKIMRLNFSHATTDEVELRMKNLALAQVRSQNLLFILFYRSVFFSLVPPDSLLAYGVYITLKFLDHSFL